MNNAELKERIYQLEVDLMKLEEGQLHTLLADDFVEFGRSGNVYMKRDQISFSKQKPREPLYDISEFVLKELSPEVFLATYKTVRLHDNQQTLRSSIWRVSAESCQMVFHQGTPYNN